MAEDDKRMTDAEPKPRRGLMAQAGQYLTATVLSRAVAVVAIPILVTRMTPTEYGYLGLIQSALPLLVPVLTLGMTGAVPIAYAHDRRASGTHTELSAAVTYCVAVGGVLIAAAVLSTGVHVSQFTPSEVAFAFLLVALSVVAAAVEGYQRSSGRSLTVSSSRIAREVGLLALITVLALVLNVSLTLVLGAMVLAELFRLIILFRPVQEVRSLIRPGSLALTSSVMAFALPLVPHAASTVAIHYGDRWILGAFQSVAMVGVYTLAYQIAGLSGSITGAYNEAVSAHLLTSHREHGREGLVAVHDRTAWSYIFIGLGGALAIGAAGWVYLWYFAPAAYRPAAPAMLVILIGLAAQSASLPFVNALLASRRTKTVATLSAAAAITNLGSNLLLVPRFGIMGAAAATALAYTVMFVATAIVVRRDLGLNGLTPADFVSTVSRTGDFLGRLVVRVREWRWST